MKSPWGHVVRLCPEYFRVRERDEFHYQWEY